MPNFDQTGPRGRGPMTGQGFGLRQRRGCGFGCGMGQRRGFGRGWNQGRGFGRGCFVGFGWRRPTQTEYQQDLTAYQEALEEELKAVKIELAELETK